MLSLYHPDIRVNNVSEGLEIGPEAMADYVSLFLPTQPEEVLSPVDRIRVDGDTAILQWEIVMRQRKSGMLKSFAGVEIIQVKDEKIYRIREFSTPLNHLRTAQAGNKADPMACRIGLDQNRLGVVADDLQTYFDSSQAFLDPDLSLAQVAEATGYTRNQISYVLNHVLEISFYEYLNRARVEAILLQLQQPEPKGVTELAFSMGFNSVSTFYKAFKKRTGITPSAYLKQVSA